MRFHRCIIYHLMSIICSHVSMISKIEPLDLTLMSTSTEISHLLIDPRPALLSERLLIGLALTMLSGDDKRGDPGVR